MQVVVPDVVRRKAESVGAGAWADDLPALVTRLVDGWDLRVVRMLTGGTEAWVAEVTLPTGASAVLKLVVPRHRSADTEIAVLRAVDGDGCVRLLDADVGAGALLLDRLGDPLSEAGLGAVERQRVLVRLAQRVWRPVPPATRALGVLVDGRRKAESLAEYIEEVWASTGRPLPPSVIDHALACAHRRAEAWDPARAVLVHGDLHRWNALRHGDDWALIDPDGIEVEPEYDLGVVMREDPDELLEEGARARAERLAAWTGCDPVAIWEWGVVERVSTGMLARSIGLEPIGTRMLAVAERIAADPGF